MLHIGEKGGGLDSDNLIGHKSKWYRTDEIVNLKYPQNVGEDFNTTLNYNSHESSEYAKMRINDKREGFGIKEEAYEPFMFFEFLEVMSEDKFKDLKTKNKAIFARHEKKAGEIIDTIDNHNEDDSEESKVFLAYQMREFGELSENEDFIEAVATDTSIFDKAKRLYNGSIALYMPTDIAINDTMIYNENSRTIAGTLEGMFGPEKADWKNQTTMTSTAFLGGVGGIGGWISETLGKNAKFLEKAPKIAAKLGAIGKGFGVIGGAAAAQVIGPEMQRHTGRLMNPHEYMAYQSTGMRNFTFNWTFLPDNSDESDQAALIIKQFRKAAHATRDDYLRITVPDQVIVTFHGAGEHMIQLPPVVIESVGVTYNPNMASYFKHKNAPVEIALTVTLKEIVPLYSDDVEDGF